jgi:hypothetical protein
VPKGKKHKRKAPHKSVSVCVRRHEGSARCSRRTHDMVAIASPAAAVKARAQRVATQRQEAETVVVAKQKRQRKRARAGRPVGSKARVATDVDAQQHGRLRLHGPRKLVFNEDDQRRALAEKTQRRTVHLHAVLASGAAEFDAAPGREDYADDEDGAALHEEAFNEYVDGNFDDAGAEVISLDQRDRKVGMFGDWLEASGHGKYVEWVKDAETGLYRLDAVCTEGGEPLVPRPAAIMEFALKASRGDKSVPKGGRPEYRNGPQYKSVLGKRQGDRMLQAQRNTFGQGPYSKTKYVFTTLEQYVSAVRKFYDEVRRAQVECTQVGEHEVAECKMHGMLAGTEELEDRKPSAQFSTGEGDEDNGAQAWARTQAFTSGDAGGIRARDVGRDRFG